MRAIFILSLISFTYVFNLTCLYAADDFLDLNLAAKQEKLRKDGFDDQEKFNNQFDRLRDRGEIGHNEDLLKWEELRYEAMLEYKKQKAKQKKVKIVENESESDENFRLYLLDQEKEKNAYERTRERYVSTRNKLAKQSHPLTLEEELKIPEKRPRYEHKNRVLYGARQKLGSKSKIVPGTAGSSGTYSPPPPSPSAPTFQNDFGVPPPTDSFSPDGDFPPPPPMDNFGSPPGMDPAFGAPPFPNDGDFVPPPPPMSPDQFGEFPPPEF